MAGDGINDARRSPPLHDGSQWAPAPMSQKRRHHFRRAATARDYESHQP
jgi:hypothetical protein